MEPVARFDSSAPFALLPSEVPRVRRILAPWIRHTPVLRASGAELGLGSFALTLKLELLQHTGSFKCRGAFANLLTRAVPAAGVVAASGGNHGVAVAYAAMRLGIPATIFVPVVSSPVKVERIRSCGAEVVVGGERYADALAASEERVAATGALAIHAFDQIETLLGQGTVAAELVEQAPTAATVLVAVGGGGLIGGMALAYDGGARLVGVEPTGAPTLAHALAAGRPVDAPTGSIAADSLAPRRVGELTFPLAQRFVERVELVDDDEIRHAQQVLWDVFRLVAEPGGATALAALLARRYVPAPGEEIVVVLCGSNTSR